jgi:lipoprotein-anchoring transpeptidase ErfK/SrfK
LVGALGVAVLLTAAPAGAARDLRVRPPTRDGGATLARIVSSGAVVRSPARGGVVTRLTPFTSPSDEPQTLLVLGSERVKGRQWLRVLLPIRPDGSTGWIPRGRVELSHTPYWVRVIVAARRVLVYRRGSLMRTFRAVVGKPTTPTPRGLAAIYEEDPQPSPHDFLGTWALPLTILSHALHSFAGGPGRVAIHGRGGRSLADPLGSAASHGCIRINNGPVDWMARHLPLGTPVDIT